MEADRRHRPGNLGPTGLMVASNLARIREGQGISTTQLAARLKEAGRPIAATSITKIEKGTRRVDADDLVALAVVLGVTPLTLLLPPVADQSPVEITAAGTLTARRAWRWADGVAPLGDDDDPAEFHIRSRPRGRRFLPEVFKKEAGTYVDPATGERLTLLTEEGD